MMLEGARICTCTEAVPLETIVVAAPLFVLVCDGDPKRKVAIDAVVAVVQRYLL